MKYAVNEEGVAALRGMSTMLIDAEEQIYDAIGILKDISDDYDGMLGPHKSSLEDVIENIQTTTQKSTESIKMLSEYLEEIAEGYQEIIDDNAFAGINVGIGTSVAGQATAGTDAGSVSGAGTSEKPSSQKLRKNMEAKGVPIPDYPYAAHHIVAGGANKPAAIEARAILEKYGIGINDAGNGVYLPRVRGVSDAEYHPALHTNTYHKAVKDLLSEAQCKQDVLDILEYIAESLSDGTFCNWEET